MDYPGCQRLFMRVFRFRSSLKRWPTRKASGPERHPFDSAQPITTLLIPKHSDSGCFWSVRWRYRMFQTLWLDYNHNRRVIGTRVVWRWQGSNVNNPSTHHVRFHFLEENWKYQMPVRTEDFDNAIAEVIGTFDGVEEIWEGTVNYYLKERHIGGLADKVPDIWSG